jgi:hypothetical protein
VRSHARDQSARICRRIELVIVDYRIDAVYLHIV